MFVGPGTEVYEGMIVGENARADDMDVNPTKEKKLTNVRSSTGDELERLIPPKNMAMEQALEFCRGDECIEVTPAAVRIRKVVLSSRRAGPHPRPRQERLKAGFETRRRPQQPDRGLTTSEPVRSLRSRRTFIIERESFVTRTSDDRHCRNDPDLWVLVPRPGRQAVAASWRVPRRLAQHGELHHGVRRERDADAHRGAAGDRRRPGRAVLRASAHPVLRRARMRRSSAEAGFNLVRIAVGYKHLEDDARPFEIKADGFRHLDRAIEALAQHGVYSIVDLHALPGSQNQHWHSDNPTHVPAFWQHRHFQDRVVHIWEAIADHYRDNPWVAGYNLLNEPADESRSVVGPFYRRLVAAIRAVDPDHVVFLDGNTYATEFDVFDEPFENAVYTLHDYVPAGLGRSPHYSREEAEQKFLERSAYARSTGTPILVGEFGPIYTGDEARDARLRGILADQLDLYRRHQASWALWMYKDIGRQGLVSVRPDTPYRRRFDDFVAKKNRLAADQWGSDGIGVAEVTQPVQDLIAQGVPGLRPVSVGALRLGAHPAAQHHHRPAAGARLRQPVPRASTTPSSTRSPTRSRSSPARSASRSSPSCSAAWATGPPMRAAVLRETGTPLQLEDVELDEPKAREVLVRIEAAGVCHSDLHYMTGDLQAKLPLVVGHEGAGIVEAVGPRGGRPGVRRRPGGPAVAAALWGVRGMRWRQPGALPVRPGARDAPTG